MNESLADRICGAFAAGEFAKAQHLWNELADQLRQKIMSGSATREMLSETRALLEWSAVTVKVHQAHASAQLRQLHLAVTYQGAGPQPVPGVRTSF